MNESENDPLVEEARRAGDAYMKQFGYDVKAAFADLRRRTDEARRTGRTVVSRPPRRVSFCTTARITIRPRPVRYASRMPSFPRMYAPVASCNASCDRAESSCSWLGAVVRSSCNKTDRFPDN